MAVEVSITHVELESEILHYVVVRDITDRKRAAAALAEEATRRRVLFERSKDGVVVVDAGAKTIESNQSFAHMLGYSVEEMLQLHVWGWDDLMTRDQILEKMGEFRSAPATFETATVARMGHCCLPRSVSPRSMLERKSSIML